MNQTPNYNLNQWERSDRVLMEDFNADNAKLDAALKAEADARAAKDAALQTEVNAKATTSALTALTSRVATLEQGIYIGSYTGDGSSTRKVSLPWEPKLLLLLGSTYENRITYLVSQNNLVYVSGYTPYESPNELSPLLTGSTLTLRHASWSNTSGTTYRYIIFR